MNEMTVTSWREITQVLAPIFDRQNVLIKVNGNTAELVLTEPAAKTKTQRAKGALKYAQSANKPFPSNEEISEICSDAATLRYKRSLSE